MAGVNCDGAIYNHSARNLVLAVFICLLILLIAGGSLKIWDLAHHDHRFSVAPFPIIVVFLPLMRLFLISPWQLRDDGLWGIRGKKTAIASYGSIETVRIVKTRKNGSKLFEIVAAGKTHKLDVLEGDAFERDLAGRIGTKIVTA